MEDNKQIHNAEDVLAYLIENHSEERCMLKMLEELAELSEKGLKWLTKDKKHRPTKEDLIEEIGDVWVRSAVVMKKMDIDEAVMERMEKKIQEIGAYYKLPLQKEKA